MTNVFIDSDIPAALELIPLSRGMAGTTMRAYLRATDLGELQEEPTALYHDLGAISDKVLYFCDRLAARADQRHAINQPNGSEFAYQLAKGALDS